MGSNSIRPPEGFLLDGVPVRSSIAPNRTITPPPGFTIDRPQAEPPRPAVNALQAALPQEPAAEPTPAPPQGPGEDIKAQAMQFNPPAEHRDLLTLANTIGAPDYDNANFEADAEAARRFGAEGAKTLGLSALQVLAAPGRVATDMAKVFPYLALGADKLLGILRDNPEQPGWLGRQAQESIRGLQAIKGNLTFVDEGLTDTATSFALGGGAGTGTRLFMEGSRPMAAAARAAGIAEPLSVTAVKSGLSAAAGDKLVVDPALRAIERKVADADLDPATKEVILSTAPLVIGMVSGATIETKIDRVLKNPLAMGLFESAARQKATPEQVMEKFRGLAGMIQDEAPPPPKGFEVEFKASEPAAGVHGETPGAPLRTAAEGPRMPSGETLEGAPISAIPQREEALARPQALSDLAEATEPAPVYQIPPQQPQRAEQTRTLRGAIKKMGGVNPLNFRGEFKESPPSIKYLLKKSGEPIDLAEQRLRDEGWLRQDENLLEVLRDPANLRRNKVAGEGIEKPEAQLTDAERRVKKQMAWEPEAPPEGDYVTMAAEDLPKGKKLTLIDNSTAAGWDVYEVIEKDPFGVKLRDGVTIDLRPGDRIEVRRQDLPGQTGKPSGETQFNVHPATVTGPLGGIMGGVDWEQYEKDGSVIFDPKKALIGAMAGTVIGAGYRPGRQLGRQIAFKWDNWTRARVIEPLKDFVSGLIVNEDLRHGLGLNRSPALQDMLRDHHRSVEQAWNYAAEVGQRLREIAPTDLEQKRLYQVLRGSVTANPKTRQQAEEVRQMFTGLREKLGDYKLLEYSRFDKLTRRERAELRDIINHPKNFNATPEDVEFARSRLNDYYHFGSAQEYAPIYYKRHEGLTPKERGVLEDEISRLKVKSRRGNPEGNPQLEAMIAGYERMLGRGAGARKELRVQRHQLNLNYSHRRDEIPIEVQRAMGLIEQAAFPAAKALGVQKSDILKAELFEDISKKPEWFIPRSTNKFAAQNVPENFVQVEDARFGALNGGYLRRDVWEDLKEIEEWRGAFVRNWDRMMGAWKYGKVVLNPATHARNFMSNVVLAYLADVSPADVGTYGKAFDAVRKGSQNRFYKEAEDWGLFNNTFVSSEITKLRDEIEGLRDPNSIKNWLRKAASLPADVYQGSETLFKMAVYIKGRESGLDVDAAARKAEEFLFNYNDIPPWVKHTKRWASPFFTFTYKAVPKFAEMAIRKPHKVGALMAAMYGLEEFSKHALGISDEEAEAERRMLPDWQQRKAPPGVGPHVNALMPFRDAWGNNLYLDLAYVLPYGNVAEKWGQSAIPLGDLLPSSPVFQTAAAILTNKEPFTGRPVYNEILDGAGEITAKYLDLVWKEAMPSLAPGGFGWNKLMTGIKNTFMGGDVRDWADRPIEFSTAVLSSLFGIKMSPAAERQLERFELQTRKKIAGSVEMEVGKLKTKFRRNEISREEFEQESRDLYELKRKLLQERPGRR